MMDFTDITTAVKKTTKKAADLAMKPVNFVADPMIEANNKLKKSVFWPDLTMLTTLKTQQQDKLFHTNYLVHIEQVTKLLRGKKMPVKKLNAYIQACKLIEAAPEKTVSLEDKVDLMQELFDELRISCKQGIPTKLKEKVFSLDKKTTYTTDEFSSLSDQIAATKKFINSLYNNIENDMVPLFLTKKADAEGVLLGVQEKRKKLSDQQKAYQESLFAYNDEINSGRSLVNEIVGVCDRLRKYHNNQDSLFWPEKTKYKGAAEAELKKLKGLLSKEFPARQSKIKKAATETSKLQTEYDKTIPSVLTDWTKFFNEWKTQEKILQTSASITKKNYSKLLSAGQKSLTGAQKSLQETHVKLIKQLTEPYDQVDLFTKQIEQVHQMHSTIHDDYLAVATHHWTTSVAGELSLCHQDWLIDQRVNYLGEEMSILRQQILYTKLTKRVWNSMADTVKSFENRIDDRKIYAKELLIAPLKQLRTLTTELQEKVKFLEKQIKENDTLLSKDKSELRDSISYKRLINLKRTWQQDMLWFTLWTSHSTALNSEIKTQTERKKSLDTLTKNIQKKQKIDHIALDEQQKTVTLVKTKEQKDKLTHLEKQVEAQEKLQKEVHTELETGAQHSDETVSLQKKYQSFWKSHQLHAQRYKKMIDDASKKLTKSPLQAWVDCSNKVINMFA